MDWEHARPIWGPWTEQTHAYVAAINGYVAKGMTEGWESAGEQPADPRLAPLAAAVIELVRKANEQGEAEGLRERVATAYAPFIDQLEAKGQPVWSLTWIDETRVIATLGAPWQLHNAWIFGVDGSIEPLPEVELVGRTGEMFALGMDDHIELRRGWDGAPSRLALPTGHEGLDSEGDDLDGVLQLLPLPDGSGVVSVTDHGVFLSEASGVRRLFPDAQGLDELRASHAEHAPDEPFLPSFDMIHAAVSPDGELIACGAQSGAHVVVRRDGRRVASFGPVYSEYPHHAAFSPDGSWACFNSCHFYNGATVALTRADLHGFEAAAYDEDDRYIPIDGGSRVYASTWVGERIALGDAHGYLRLYARDGEPGGQHYVGGTTSGLATSPDGRYVAAGTYAGFLSILDTRSDSPDPACIGTTGWAEVVRFVAWKGEPIWRW